MPLYEFKCKGCGQIVHSTARINEESCDDCGGALRRVFSFSFKRPMQPHFNTAVGRDVAGERDLKNEFRRMSDAAEERTGIPHNYQPVDPRDKDTLGVTDEGLGDRFDADVKAGIREPVRKLV